jgi:hypothetical protein
MHEALLEAMHVGKGQPLKNRLRLFVDLGLACGASPRSTEQRAMRAVCGYLCYTG